MRDTGASDSAEGARRFSSLTETRRKFLAATAGGAALGSAFVSPAFGKPDEEDKEDGDQAADGQEDCPEDAEPAEAGEFQDDLDVLNFALTLEFLEARFYREGLDNIGEREILRSETIKGVFRDPLDERLFQELRTIQRHEEAHVQTLQGTIEDLGGQPIAEPEFDFGSAVEVPEEFIQTAVVLEDTGVSAYGGAIPSLADGDLLRAALSIRSVEGRHASFLRVLNNEIGFPDAFDQPLNRSQVEQAISQFLVE